ncbi:MAG: hypothetical protein ACOCTT_03550 [archaeon]
MVSKILSGSEILRFERKQKNRKNNKTPKKWPLRSITPIKAAKNIRKKYGKVSRSGNYYHRGKGEMTKHDSKRDRKIRSRKSPKYRGNSRHRGDY